MRFAAYGAAWIFLSTTIFGCIIALATLLLFYTTLGPFACLYVGARIGTICGFDIFHTSLLMLAGLWLFGSVRVQLYRHVLRYWRGALATLNLAYAEREGLTIRYLRQ